jgi:hypothetical protein
LARTQAAGGAFPVTAWRSPRLERSGLAHSDLLKSGYLAHIIRRSTPVLRVPSGYALLRRSEPRWSTCPHWPAASLASLAEDAVRGPKHLARTLCPVHMRGH